MQVLITGCGLIGAYTAKELTERGDEVTLFDLQPNLEYLRKVLGRDLPMIRGDIRELPALIEAMQRTQAEVVFHSAGLQGSRTPYFGFQVNLIGTLNVAEAVRLTGVRRLIHASSQGVYDLRNPPVPIHEEARRDGGARVYQGGKAACEEVLTAYADTYKFELALPRFASVYGYGPYTGGGNVGMDMYAMLQAALSGKPAPMGPGIADANDFVYVKDIAQGLRLLTCAATLPHQAYNLGTGVAATVADIQRGLQKISATCALRASSPPGRGRRSIFPGRGRNWVMSRSSMSKRGCGISLRR